MHPRGVEVRRPPYREKAGSPPRRHRLGSGSPSRGTSSAAERPSPRACGRCPGRCPDCLPARGSFESLSWACSRVPPWEENTKRTCGVWILSNLALRSISGRVSRIRRRGRGLPARALTGRQRWKGQRERSWQERPGAEPRASAPGTAPSTAPKSRRTERAPESSSYPIEIIADFGRRRQVGRGRDRIDAGARNGWQRSSRLRANQLPCRAPCRCSASAAYSEQVGSNRQHGPTSAWYARREHAPVNRTSAKRIPSWREPNPESTREQPNLAAQGLLVGACCRRTSDHHEVDGRGHAGTAQTPTLASPALQAIAENSTATLRLTVIPRRPPQGAQTTIDGDRPPSAHGSEWRGSRSAFSRGRCGETAPSVSRRGRGAARPTRSLAYFFAT